MAVLIPVLIPALIPALTWDADHMSGLMSGRRPFVGRAAELAEIGGRVDALSEGHGAIVLIRGPAGIGKTRLVEEAVAGRDARVGRGYAADDQGAPPLWPWLRVCSAVGLRDVVPALQRVPDQRRATEGEAAAERFRRLAEAADLLTAVPDPVVLVLEDLHWADRASLDLLRTVAAAVAGSRLAVLATTRAASLDHETQFGLLQRFPATVSLELDPLTVADVATFLGASGAASAERVHRDTGGLPLLLAAAPAGLRTPTAYDVRRIAFSLLAQAGGEARDLVETAAVLGEQVDRTLLRQVTGADVDSGLTAAARAGVLAEDESRFTHALIRDALAEAVPPGRAAEIHAAAADRLAAETPASPPRVAAHLLAAGDERAAEAATWSRRAADEAANALAYDDALRFLKAAESSLLRAGAGEEALAETRLELAHAAYLAGHPVDALATCRLVSDAMVGLRPDLVAEAALVVRGLSWPAADQTNAALAVRALDTHPPEAVRSRLLSQLAASQSNTDRLREGERTAALAWQVALESGDPEALLDAAQAREATLLGPDDSRERLRISLAAAEYAERLDRPVAAALAQGWRMRAAYALADVGQVDACLESLSSLSARTGVPLVEWHRLRATVAQAALEGRFSELTPFNERARSLAEASGDIGAASMSVAIDVHLALLRGDAGRAPDLLDATESVTSTNLIRLMRAQLHCLIGDRVAAEQQYSRLRRLLWQPEADLRWGGVLLGMAQLVEEFGDAEAAAEVARQLEPWRALRGSLGIHTAFFGAPVAGHLGRALVVAGRGDEAEPLLRDSVDMCAALRARPHLAQARCDLAQRLLAVGTAADRTEARGLLAAADKDVRVLSMPGTASRVASLRDLLHDEVLSPREREIAELVVAAMTNREIAAKLYISERTVETHVRSLLGKAGCASRTELVARREELGL